jgi:hypothetical protein
MQVCKVGIYVCHCLWHLLMGKERFFLKSSVLVKCKALLKFCMWSQKAQKKNVHVTWKAKLEMCQSHGKQEKKMLITWNCSVPIFWHES